MSHHLLDLGSLADTLCTTPLEQHHRSILDQLLLVAPCNIPVRRIPPSLAPVDDRFYFWTTIFKPKSLRYLLRNILWCGSFYSGISSGYASRLVHTKPLVCGCSAGLSRTENPDNTKQDMGLPMKRWESRFASNVAVIFCLRTSGA